MFHLIWKFILGLIVGYVARLLLPGADRIGFWLTGLVGVLGSFGGHWLARMLGFESGERPRGRILSALISVAGALVLLLALRFLQH